MIQHDSLTIVDRNEIGTTPFSGNSIPPELLFQGMNTIVYRLKLYFALSRTPHGILDMATPAFCVLVYLGAFPPARVVAIGLLTAFAGYTAVYALNDIIDYRSDCRKCRENPVVAENYLDSVIVRHPLAEGLLTFREGVAWAVGWSAVAMIGAWLLNPVCVAIFLAGAALETIYCLLWRVSPWRAVVSGFVKNMGAVAALFAVDPTPAPGFMLLLFLCLFFWEIGGQNIPADWTDIDADRRSGAQTIPVRLGESKSAMLALVSLANAATLGPFLFSMGFPAHRWTASLAALAIGAFFLIAPAVRLNSTHRREHAIALFNRASYFPATLLGLAWVLILHG